MKLFRSILPIFFFFLSLGAMAQMDKDGNFHWDELYTPDEVLELDMSLPNKVDVSAIKNRERVKYVKLKCYPWIEHIPFTPEDFPNIEALRIETYLLVDLKNLELFTGLKRLGVTEPNCTDVLIRFIQSVLPQPYANRIWTLPLIEDLDFSLGSLFVKKNTISKLSNLLYVNNIWGAFAYDEIKKIHTIQQCTFCKEVRDVQEFDENNIMKQGQTTFMYSYKPYITPRIYQYYNNIYEKDTIYELSFCPDLHPYYDRTYVKGSCFISDTIMVYQYGRERNNIYYEDRNLCVYSPQAEKLILLCFCLDETNKFRQCYYFLTIDFRKNILISLGEYENHYDYVIEDNKVFVINKDSGYLGYPIFGNFGESGCKKSSFEETAFEYFELLDGTLKISELKKAQMLDSYKKEYEKQIEFAKSLKSLEIFITNHKKQ